MTQEVEARLSFTPERHTDFEVLKDQETDHLGIHAQKQAGLFWVGVNFSGGRIRQSKLAAVADLAAKYCAPGIDAIRLTNKQNLLIVNVPEANLGALKAELNAHGLVYESSNFRQGCVSCTGI